MSRPTPVDGIRAVIADDEQLARDGVRVALEKARDVHVIAECADGYEAVEAIRALQPDLIFLDVQMPDLDGLGVLEHIGADAMPDVIFVTAFDEHALRAFETHALDYVLKPFDDRRLDEAVQHARTRLRFHPDDELSQRLRSLLEDAGRGARPAAPYAARIMVRERDRMRFVRVREIDWIEAQGNYLRLYVGTGRHLIRATLSGLLERLDPALFVRIHRSMVVNLDSVAEVQPWTGGDLIALLRDGKKLRVSRNYKEGLLQSVF